MARKTRLEVNLESRRGVVMTALNKTIRGKVYLMGQAVHRKLLLEVLVGERTGNWYKVPKTNRMYRASAPGEAPATRTGDLRRSYRVGDVEQDEHGQTHVRVGSDLPYSAPLELDMNREHLEPAVELAKPDIRNILDKDWGIK